MEVKELIGNFKAMAVKAISTVKEETDDFKDRWAPEIEEASNRYETLKKKLEASVVVVENLLKDQLNQHPEEFKKIKTTIEDLKLQLTLGKAETLEAFEEQKKQILVRWKLLKSQLEELPEFYEIKDRINHQLDEWRVQLEVMKIQFALGRMEWKQDWKHFSSELGREVDNLGKALEAGAGIAGEKLDRVEEELQKIFKKYTR